MKVYHLSEHLKLGDILVPDYTRCAPLAEPFVQGLEKSIDCFCSMVFSGRYLQAVLEKVRLREWSDCGKWAAEGAFEYLRRREFPGSVSRLSCNYFYDNLSDSVALFHSDWDSATAEEQAGVRLYEIDLEDEAPQRRDMALFDRAYQIFSEGQEFREAFDLARRYFSGEGSPSPVWELLSDRKARALVDLTHLLRE